MVVVAVVYHTQSGMLHRFLRFGSHRVACAYRVTTPQIQFASPIYSPVNQVCQACSALVYSQGMARTVSDGRTLAACDSNIERTCVCMFDDPLGLIIPHKPTGDVKLAS